MAEALVGGALFSGVINVVFDRIFAIPTVNLVFGKKLGARLVERLKISLMAAEALVADAEHKQHYNVVVMVWLNRLRDAVYAADNLLDAVLTKAATQKEVRSFFPNPEDWQIANKIEDVVARIESLVKQEDSLGLEKFTTRSFSRRAPSTSLIRGNVYGREDDKQALIKMLNDNNEHHLSVNAVVGMGGVGKTTLAQWLYNNEEFMKGFDLKAWVCVSENFDTVETTRNLMKGIHGGTCSLDNFSSLRHALKEELSKKKFFIVLDDVWSDDGDTWSNFMTTFQFGKKESVVLLTTREKNVASVVQDCRLYFLNGLSEDYCWLVFADNASFPQSNGSAALEEIGRKIVKKCDGLPLAAETLGRLSRTKHDVTLWNKILKSRFWEFPMKEGEIISALFISYDRLPTYLKLCFVYCSLFPKDYYFDKDKLILLWMAENILPPPKRGETLEEIGCKFFDELISKSFFEKVQFQDNYFVMHNLLHDLAIFLAGDFYCNLEEAEIRILTRHLSFGRLNSPNSETLNSIGTLESLRTSLYVDDLFSMESIASKLKCLRVLSFYELDVLPDLIGSLIHLRYLNLSWTNIKTLPESLCNLYNLQTLMLYDVPS